MRMVAAGVGAEGVAQAVGAATLCRMDNRELERFADEMLATLDAMAKFAWERKQAQIRTEFVDSEEEAVALSDVIRPIATERIRRGMVALTVTVGAGFGKIPLPGGSGATAERWMCRMVVECSEEPPAFVKL